MTSVASNEQERARDETAGNETRGIRWTMRDVIVDGGGYRRGGVFLRRELVEGRRKGFRVVVAIQDPDKKERDSPKYPHTVLTDFEIIGCRISVML